MGNIDGKSAVVTGATRGIGLAIVRALLERGGRVLICARSEKEVEQTAASLRSMHGENVYATMCDVRSYNSVRSLFH